MGFDDVKQRIEKLYQQHSREYSRATLRSNNTPTTSLLLQAEYLAGRMQGLRDAMGLMEEAQDQELPLEG